MASFTTTNNAQEAQLTAPGGPQSAPLVPGASKVRELFAKGQQAIRSQQYEYWLNHAYLMGEQHLWWNPQTRSLDQLPRDPDRVQMTVNKLWPSSRTLISKATSRSIVFDVPPTGADDATIQAAQTAESILNSLVREHGWEGVREALLWGAWKGGTAAICVEWDNTLGTPLGVRGDGQVYSTGDTVETPLTIADFVCEPGVRDGEKGRWWIKNLALPPEKVQDMFGMATTPAADATAALTPFQNKLMSEHAGMGDAANVALTQVMTYYERPSNRNPQGAMVVVVGDQVVDSTAWPFPFKDHLNLAIVRETLSGNRWTGDTVLKAGRSVQNGINQAWSSIVEHMKLAGNARLFVPQSMVDLIQDLTDLPGEIVPYPDNETPPQWTSPPQMPAWWLQQPVQLGMELDTILGVHDVSRGQAPVNIESGVGLSILLEQDETPLGRLIKETALAFGKVGQMVLELYQENVLETRQAVIKTPGQPADTAHWTGGDLMGQVGANVPLDAIMPRSRAAQLEFAKQAMQMGLITTFEQFVKVADIPDQRDLLEALSPDVSKARRENHKMAMGIPEPPAMFDQHGVHIQEHLVFMKGPRWDTLTPQQQEIFLLHNQAHANMDAELMARQLLKGQMSPVLAAAADPNGAPTLPLGALGTIMPPAPGPGGPGGTPAGAGGGPLGLPGPNAPVPGHPDAEGLATGKQIGNSRAANKGAGHQFNNAAGVTGA